MTTHINVDRAACQRLRTELDVALSKFAEESGLKISIRAMKYTGSTMEPKLDVALSKFAEESGLKISAGGVNYAWMMAVKSQ